MSEWVSEWVSEWIRLDQIIIITTSHHITSHHRIIIIIIIVIIISNLTYSQCSLLQLDQDWVMRFYELTLSSESSPTVKEGRSGVSEWVSEWVCEWMRMSDESLRTGIIKWVFSYSEGVKEGVSGVSGVSEGVKEWVSGVSGVSE